MLHQVDLPIGALSEQLEYFYLLYLYGCKIVDMRSRLLPIDIDFESVLNDILILTETRIVPRIVEIVSEAETTHIFMFVIYKFINFNHRSTSRDHLSVLLHQ